MKLRMLFVAPEFPYPAFSGGCLRTLSLLRCLAAHFEIHLVTFAETPLDEKDIEALRAWVAGVSVLPRCGAMPGTSGGSCGPCLHSWTVFRRLTSVLRSAACWRAKLIGFGWNTSGLHPTWPWSAPRAQRSWMPTTWSLISIASYAISRGILLRVWDTMFSSRLPAGLNGATWLPS